MPLVAYEPISSPTVQELARDCSLAIGSTQTRHSSSLHDTCVVLGLSIAETWAIEEGHSVFGEYTVVCSFGVSMLPGTTAAQFCLWHEFRLQSWTNWSLLCTSICK